MVDRGNPVAIAVDARTIELTADDRVLAEAIRRRGIEVRPTVWGTGFTSAGPVVIRSPYDYVERPEEFRAWLDALDESGTTVINPTSLLRWNLHKRYLSALAARGVPVVPTAMLARGSSRPLGDLMVGRGWSRAVIKPAIGASARETITVDGTDSTSVSAAQRHISRLVRAEDVLVQPFIPSIETDGELSVVVIGGEVTHAVLKRASVGEWRVQSDFGGSAERIAVTAEYEQVVASVLKAVAVVVDAAPVYARVDMVRVDGRLHLMELELIEPELFFVLAPESAERLAGLVAAEGLVSAETTAEHPGTAPGGSASS